MTDIIKQLQDKDGNNVLPVTHVNAVVNSEGDTLPEILDRDYPTTSKTPVLSSSEVSLVTRGEKYEWNKVGNASDATGASDITSTFKYLLLNGTTGEFETALKSYVEESVRAAIGSLINNLDKGTGIKAIAGIDNSNDLGTITPANLASLLGGVMTTLKLDLATSEQEIKDFCVGSDRKCKFFAVGWTASPIGQGDFALALNWDINASMIIVFARFSRKLRCKIKENQVWDSSWTDL